MTKSAITQLSTQTHKQYRSKEKFIGMRRGREASTRHVINHFPASIRHKMESIRRMQFDCARKPYFSSRARCNAFLFCFPFFVRTKTEVVRIVQRTTDRRYTTQKIGRASGAYGN